MKTNIILIPLVFLLVFGGIAKAQFPGTPYFAGSSKLIAAVTSLDCNGAVYNGIIQPQTPASGVTIVIPYTGGNGGTYSGQSFASTGLTGLTATIPGGTLNIGSGTLTFTITGTTTSAGYATFLINIAGQNCTIVQKVGCGAYVGPGNFKNFMCHNLGADTNANPYIPSAAIHGAKYAWGAQTGESGRYYSQANDQSNSDVIVGWNGAPKPAGSWSDGSKTANDPCPSGYRVPTSAQWQAVINNNNVSYIGSGWSSYPSNYDTGLAVEGLLFLPAAGYRDATYQGWLDNRGAQGMYYSTTTSSASGANFLYFQNGTVAIGSGNRAYGFSIRCIAE